MKKSLLFSEAYNKLWKNVKVNDIIPVGKLEDINIEKNHKTVHYPNVIKLKKSFSCDRLLKDFTSALPSLKNKKASFFEKCTPFLIKTNMNEVLNMLHEIGFTRNEYGIYPLREFGKVELLPAVGSYTCMCLNEIGRHFRQFYTVPQPGWCSKPHIDNQKLEWHGFRIILPINVDGYIGFISRKKIQIYKLSKGIPHFCNTAALHFGINPLKTKRISLNFHIASDKNILTGVEIEPETDNYILQKHIPWKKELYENYDQLYQSFT